MKKALNHLSQDPIMKKLIDKHGRLPPITTHHQDLFTNLVHEIVGQQLSGKVVIILFDRLKSLLSSYPFDPEEIV